MPQFVTGALAKLDQPLSSDPAIADRALRPVLPAVLAPFRLQAWDLELRKMNTDESGARHFRYRQRAHGLDVVGGDLVVHVDAGGTIFAVNGTARGDISHELGATGVGRDEATARIARDPRFAMLRITNDREVYLQTEDNALYRAFEVVVEGERDGEQARDKVYVDVETGEIVAVHPQIHSAKSRRMFTANNTDVLPGTLVRVEGQGPTGDFVVDDTFTAVGHTYDAYAVFWNRDSYDHAGSQIQSTVHFKSNYCNAAWDGTRMKFGDGNGTTCTPLGRAVDITAHEYTHAVTDSESNLTYSGESGGMNEAMSDIFGAFVESYVDGGASGPLRLSADTWKVGEDALSTALRKMCDPASDGVSADFWYSGVGNLDVHYSSGIGNLAFCLLATGGSHPRGDSSLLVTGVGMDKAIRILYKAQRDILTSNANYAAVRTAMEQAALQTGNDQATIDAVSCAWAAVGVGSAPAACGRSDILWRNTDGNVAIWTMNGGTITGQYYPGQITGDWQTQGVGEFNGDGKADILWRNTDGTLAIWYMNGGTRLFDGYPGVVGNEWQFQSIGDFDGGGSSDILWRHTNGTIAIWLMSNGVKVGEVYPGTQPTTNNVWGVGDFNGDGTTDILWRNTSGAVAMWLMGNGAVIGSPTVATETLDWKISGIGDFNDDGKADILWRNIDGTVAIWFMNGATHTGTTYPGQPGNDWIIQRVGDYNGDGTSDILWRNNDGTVAIWFIANGANASQAYPGQPGNDWVIRGTGQFD
ncbi:MAG: M4 family metallopeptidase [Kofleriaceae bacterium]